MTVCIAAKCELNGRPVVIGATDAMLTAGDVEFEPPMSKVWRFPCSVVGLLAGDSSVQTQICNKTQSNIEAAVASYNSVLSIAGEYAEQIILCRQKEAETNILRPLGLDMKSFLAGQKQFTDDFVADIADRISRVQIQCFAIIIGTDGLGGHIYSVDDYGNVRCLDVIGFAAIGSGSRLADSEFMFARYTPLGMPFSQALLLTYTAKKRAEVAPGVGTNTFVVVIVNGEFHFFVEDSPIIKLVESVYESSQKQIGRIQAKAYKSADERLQGLLSQNQQTAIEASRSASSSRPHPPATPPSSTNDRLDSPRA